MKKLALVGLGLMGGFLAATIAPQAMGADDASAQQNLFRDALERVRADYVRPVADGELINGAIQGMVSNLDPHSSYMDAKTYNETKQTTAGKVGGIGIEVNEEDGRLKVISSIDGTPASRAGLKAGDCIASIDGNSTADLEVDAAMDKIRGEAGSKITLTIQREGGQKPFDVTLVRAIVPVNATTYQREGDIGYIRMPRFNDQTADGLEQAVRELKKQIGPSIRGYVLDLRGNPGGLVSQAVRVSDDFLNSGEIVSTRGRHPDDNQRYDATDGDIAGGKPVVVLINGTTASASEIVSGALQDNKRATIVGLTSFGKGSVQSIIPLGEGRGALRLTTARYFTPSGHSIQAQGITPDVQVAQGNEADSPKAERFAEANLPGHLSGEAVAVKVTNTPVIKPAAGKKYDDFQLSYALDLLHSKTTIASAMAVDKIPTQ